MKPYQLSDDRTVSVKKKEGQWTVVIKQKDSVDKFIEFTPSRSEYYHYFTSYFIFFIVFFAYIVCVFAHSLIILFAYVADGLSFASALTRSMLKSSQYTRTPTKTIRPSTIASISVVDVTCW